MAKWTRRKALKGMLGGSAVTVALPLLDCFLNGNGEALASGAPLPARFGTWFWGCGINAARWIPDKIGADYDLKPELLAIGPYKNKVTVLSGFNCVLGGRPNLAHWSGIMATFTGAAPSKGGMGGGTTDLPTIDCLVANTVPVPRGCLHRPNRRQLQHARRLDRQSQRGGSGRFVQAHLRAGIPGSQ
jgi:uncharacterized protein DUF1552